MKMTNQVATRDWTVKSDYVTKVAPHEDRPTLP
jgi:hypothetical protein